MSLIVRTSVPSFALVGDMTLRQWLRIDPDIDAETINLLLASAVDYLEGQTGLVLGSTGYSITLDQLDPVTPIGVQPVNSVTSVAALLSDGSAQSLTLGTDYTLLLASSRPSISILNLPSNAVAVMLMLNAGYTSQAAVPAALQQAAAVLVAAGYDNRSALDPKTVETVANLISRYRAVGL